MPRARTQARPRDPAAGHPRGAGPARRSSYSSARCWCSALSCARRLQPGLDTHPAGGDRHRAGVTPSPRPPCRTTGDPVPLHTHAPQQGPGSAIRPSRALPPSPVGGGQHQHLPGGRRGAGGPPPTPAEPGSCRGVSRGLGLGTTACHWMARPCRLHPGSRPRLCRTESSWQRVYSGSPEHSYDFLFLKIRSENA